MVQGGQTVRAEMEAVETERSGWSPETVGSYSRQTESS